MLNSFSKLYRFLTFWLSKELVKFESSKSDWRKSEHMYKFEIGYYAIRSFESFKVVNLSVWVVFSSTYDKPFQQKGELLGQILFRNKFIWNTES